MKHKDAPHLRAYGGLGKLRILQSLGILRKTNWKFLSNFLKSEKEVNSLILVESDWADLAETPYAIRASAVCKKLTNSKKSAS